MTDTQRDQSLPFMFEVVPPTNSGSVTSFVLPVNPDDYQIRNIPRSQIFQTHGGNLVERRGMAPQKISLAGTFGYLGTLPGGKAKRLDNGLQLSGWELYREIEENIVGFYRAYEDDPDAPEQGEIRFFNFTDEAYYEVEINQFDLKRSIKHRHLYRYDIQMTTLRRLDIPAEAAEDKLISTFDTVPDIEEPTGFWPKLLGGFMQASSFMRDVVEKTLDFESSLTTVRQATNAFRHGLSDFIEAPFGLIQSLITTADSILETVESIDELPHEFTSHMRKTKRQLLILVGQQDKFRVPITSTGSAGQEELASSSTSSQAHEIITATPPDPITASQYGVQGMEVPELTLFSTDDSKGDVFAVAEAQVGNNETVRSLAEKHLGSSDQWLRIATFNDIEYPYIVPEGSLSAFSEELYRGLSYGDSPAGAREIHLNGYAPNKGEVVVVKINGRYVGMTVSSVDASGSDKIVVVEDAITEAIPSGSPVYVFKKALSVKRPGDKILIPGSAGKKTSIVSWDGDFAVKAYGIDEYLNSDGLHQVDGSGSEEVVSGIDNLVMQLEHRLRTVRGELAEVGHPRYGSLIPTMIGKALIPVWQERMKVEARIVLLEDPRIKSVGPITLSTEGTVTRIAGDVYPINQSAPQRFSLALI